MFLPHTEKNVPDHLQALVHQSPPGSIPGLPRTAGQEAARNPKLRGRLLGWGLPGSGWGPGRACGATQRGLSHASPSHHQRVGQTDMAPREQSMEFMKQRCSRGLRKRPPKMPEGSGGGSPTAVRQDVLLPKPELKQGEKHLMGETDVREQLPKAQRPQIPHSPLTSQLPGGSGRFSGAQLPSSRGGRTPVGTTLRSLSPPSCSGHSPELRNLSCAPEARGRGPRA